MKTPVRRITEFLVGQDRLEDYFVAKLSNGWVRLGMRGGDCFDFPPTMLDHDRILELKTPSQAEEMHDQMVGKYIINRRLDGQRPIIG